MCAWQQKAVGWISVPWDTPFPGSNEPLPLSRDIKCHPGRGDKRLSVMHDIIPAFQRLRQEDSEFQAGLGSSKIRVLFAVEEGPMGVVVWAYPSRTVEGGHNS